MRTLRSKSNRYQVRLVAVAMLALLGLIAAGCGGSSSSSMPKSGVAGATHSTSTAATVKTRKISGLGVVLVNKKGRTLYVFMKDARRKVTCTGSCASFWHPLKKPSGKLRAAAPAKTALLGSDKNPSGGRVVTYSKWPLYTYVGDSGAGQAKGEGSTLNGAKWYVISAKGTVIKHKSSGGGGGTSTGGGGGGWG